MKTQKIKLFSFKRVIFLPIIVISLFCNSNGPTQTLNQLGIKMPPGFTIDLYAEEVEGARSMVLTPNGTLFVGTRDHGNVYAVLDTNKDYKADEVITIATGLNMPNGVAFKNGNLYVAEVSRILVYENIETKLHNPPLPKTINDQLPSERAHGWKYIKFGPDGKLYVPVGAPCNICLSENEIYASLLRMDDNGSNLEIYAHGIRNTVGFDWQPNSNVLWFTDNGRDMLGDNIPPDELNKAPEKGIHFGYPFIHGRSIPDPEYGKGKDLDIYKKPEIELGPHVAALGMKFYTGNMFPNEYKNQIFIAEHGSWNRSEKIGYRVMLVKLEGDIAVSYDVFAEGWLNGNSVSGRPVDLLIMPDGSLLVSDDYSDVIYRISYTKQN